MLNEARDTSVSEFNTALSFESSHAELTTAVARPQLVVVGGGMAGQHFCERLVELGLHSSFNVTLFGEECYSAYDRVHLTQIMHGSSIDALTLRPYDWYKTNQIDLRTSTHVQGIDLEARRVLVANGLSQPFDKLVLATGSQAIRPKLPGADLERVLVYRTADDVLKLRSQVAALNTQSQPVVVVGAGLLGLEAAEALMTLGLRVRVIEAADHLLSRQLDRDSASVVGELLRRRGFEVCLGTRISEIGIDDEQALCLTQSTGEVLKASLVLFAVGIRPRDELAKAVGIRCDLFGGIEVNDRLETSAQDVYAIGECVRHRGHSYGLVAPGYAMAEALAEQLAGLPSRFHGAAQSTSLKVSGVKLSVVGESSTADDIESRFITYRDDSHWRRLVLRAGRLVGGTVVGDWEELPMLQDAVVRHSKFRPRQERRFSVKKPVWEGEGISLQSWPDAAVVCSCTGVTCGTLRRSLAQGCDNVSALTQKTGAGGVCGSCQPLLVGLVTGQVVTTVRRVAKVTLVSAALALLFATVTTLSPPIGLATRTASGFELGTLWRDPTLKQVSGFSLLGLIVVEGLISLRKRIAALRWGAFGSWRAFHSLVGAGTLLGLAVHTGFRLGHHVDRWLVVCFLLSTVAGAVAGVLVAIEPRYLSSRVSAMRAATTKAHLWLLWPLPILIAAHVVKVYFF